jgi:hypothetical protein
MCSLSRFGFHWLLVLLLLLSVNLTTVGRVTSADSPTRYRCVKHRHVPQSKHRMCLWAKKFAPWTHLSHFRHRKASSAWQYREAIELQSSQETEPFPSLDGLHENGLWLWSSSFPIHIFRSIKSQGLEEAIYRRMQSYRRCCFPTCSEVKNSWLSVMTGMPLYDKVVTVFLYYFWIISFVSLH